MSLPGDDVSMSGLEQRLLADLVAELRASAGEPAPRPTPALAELLHTGLQPRRVPTVRRPRLSGRRLLGATAAGLAAKLALTAGAAAASVTAGTVVDGPDGPVDTAVAAVAAAVADVAGAAVREPTQDRQPQPAPPARPGPVPTTGAPDSGAPGRPRVETTVQPPATDPPAARPSVPGVMPEKAGAGQAREPHEQTRLDPRRGRVPAPPAPGPAPRRENAAPEGAGAPRDARPGESADAARPPRTPEATARDDADDSSTVIREEKKP